MDVDDVKMNCPEKLFWVLQWNVSPPLFNELSAHTNAFSSLGAYFQNPTGLMLDRIGSSTKLSGVTTTAGFFDLFGVRPLAGRTFSSEEGGEGQDSVIVASYGMWQQYFGGDPQFVGKSITLSGRPYTVIGIHAPQFAISFQTGRK